MTADGAGGAIATWQDYRGGSGHGGNRAGVAAGPGNGEAKAGPDAGATGEDRIAERLGQPGLVGSSPDANHNPANVGQPRSITTGIQIIW